LDIDRLGSGGHFESTRSCEIYRTFFQEKDVQFYQGEPHGSSEILRISRPLPPPVLCIFTTR
jgi:hypothetical protein